VNPEFSQPHVLFCVYLRNREFTRKAGRRPRIPAHPGFGTAVSRNRFGSWDPTQGNAMVTLCPARD